MSQFIVQIDEETFISKDSVAVIQSWVEHSTDPYIGTEKIGTKVYLKTNQVLWIKEKTPSEVMELLK